MIAGASISTSELEDNAVTTAKITDANVTVAKLTTALDFTGNDIKLDKIVEDSTIAATAATGTINYDIKTQSVLYFTSNASGNYTLNLRGDGSTTLNSMLSDGDVITVVHLVTNGGTAYYNNAVQVDGSGVTPEWQGGSAPSSGNTNSVDAYTYSIFKTGDAAFTVFAAQTQFA